jgi:hypothetical protein
MPTQTFTERKAIPQKNSKWGVISLEADGTTYALAGGTVYATQALAKTALLALTPTANVTYWVAKIKFVTQIAEVYA